MSAEKYAKQVAKYLKCSGRRKQEIKKQITSDIQAAMEEGKSLEQAIGDMGEPKVLAAEFNDSFGETEKKVARRAKVWKVLAVVFVILFLMIMLVWWALPKTKLLSDSRIFSEEPVQERAELILELFDQGDYAALQDYQTEQMQELMVEETMEQIKTMYIGSDWGEMRNIGNVYSLELSQMGKKYAVVQMTVSYENVNVTYTMTFDEDLKLSGFYMR